MALIPARRTTVLLFGEPDLRGATLPSRGIGGDARQAGVERYDPCESLRHLNDLRRDAPRRCEPPRGNRLLNTINCMNYARSDEHAAIQHCGVCGGELHQRDADTLSERTVREVKFAPPFRCWAIHKSLAFAREVNSSLSAEAEAQPGCIESL